MYVFLANRRYAAKNKLVSWLLDIPIYNRKIKGFHELPIQG